MAIDKLPGTAIATGAIGADQIATGGITVADIPDGEITAGKLHTTLNLSSKTVTFPASSVTAHAASQLNDLTDVNTSGAANGKILKYNGSAWVVADDAGGPTDTDGLSEGSSNLYYTTARANSAIDARVTNTFINNLTINADTATTLANARTISGVAFDGSQNITLNTSAITENTNLYYTDARVRATTLTGGSLRGSVNNATVQYGSSYSGTPAQGSFFFDSLNAKLKVYDGSAFLDAVPAGGGGGGGGSTDANTTFRKYLYTIGSVGNAVSGKDDVIVTAGSFVTGFVYIIVSAGNTDFTAIGSANNNVGTQFTATGAGSGTGTASHKLNYVTDGTENVEVYVNGIKQIQGSANDYVATSGTSVNFVSNLAVNDEVEVNVFELLTNSSNFASLTVDTTTLVVNGTTNRVGIGTATPFTRAVVGGGSGTEVLTIFSGSGGEGQIRFADATSGTGSYQGRVEYDHNAGKLNLGAGGTTPFTIDSSENVGIGTTNPTAKLTTVVPHSNSAVAEALKLTTNGSYSGSNSEEAGPALSFGQYHSLYPTWKTGQISGIRDGANWHGSLSFWTNNGGSETNITEKMRVTGDGNVGIGTISPSNKLTIDIAASNTGITLSDHGDGYFPQIIYNSNRTSAGQGLGKFSSFWNGTEVARIEFAAGVDTTNKDDGEMLFYSRTSGGNLLIRNRIDRDGVLQGSSDAEILTSPIRKHSNTISTNTTIATTQNAIAGGPINVATGVTLTINGNFTVV